MANRRIPIWTSLLVLAGALWLLPGPREGPMEGDRSRNTLQGHEPADGVDRNHDDVFRAFDAWRAQRSGVPEEGVRLARMRLRDLTGLMRENPGLAEDRVLSLRELAALPAAVRAHCERPFGAIGRIDLRWAVSEAVDGRLECEPRTRVHAGGKSWRAWGASLAGGRLPRSGVPLTGWLIDGELLVAAILGEAEQGGSGGFRPALGWLEADEGGGPGGDPPPQRSPWMDDMLDVLFIRVDFADFPGEPVSKSALETTLATVSARMNDYSYGAASIAYDVTTQLYRLPETGAHYATIVESPPPDNSFIGNEELIADARAAAAGDYELADYDVVAVFFPDLEDVAGSRITYGGLASVGGANHWLNGVNSVSVILHEFGHNYGLYHANYWDPERGIGGGYHDPAASSLEYGDIFDRMGEGSVSSGYFNPYTTHQLGWLPAAKVAEASADGTWRIHRFDDPGALSNQYLSLRVPMGGDVHYWVGHRKRYGAPYNLENGAYVVAEGLYPSESGHPDRSNLIDMTPGSATPESQDRQDAGLPVGSSFHDAAAGVTISVVASGGIAPDEWIDVAVEFESRISLASTTVEVDEQSGLARLTLRRELSSEGAATVDFTTADGSAVAGGDYHASSGTVAWADGDGEDKSVLVAVRPDALVEGREHFTLSLSNPGNAVIDPQAGMATISVLDPGQRYLGFAPGFFNTAVNAVAPLAGGKVIIGGAIGAGIGGADGIRHLARLQADGSVDATFLTGTGFDAPVHAVVVQPDGRVLAGGEFTTYNGTPCNRIVRLEPDGLIDGGFVTAMGSGADGTVFTLAVEDAGTILVGGALDGFDGAAADGLVRLLPSGARDAGNALRLGWDGNAEIRVLIPREDGRIMVGGSLHYPWTGSGFRSGVVRLNPDGTRDESFAQDAGTHAAGSVSSLRNVHTLARQIDGLYLVGGFFGAYDENPASNLARVGDGGLFDASFSAPSFDNVVSAVVAQANGRTVAGGWFSAPAGSLTGLAPGGAMDPGFQPGSGPGGPVNVIARADDGSLWVGGNFFSYDGSQARPVVKIAGGVPPYDRWAAGRFTTAQVTAGDASDSADPDGDGLGNLVEMAMGTDPNEPDHAGMFGRPAAGGIALVDAAGSRYPQVAYDKPVAVEGVWYAAQFSSDLVTWMPENPTPGTNAVYDVIEDSATRFVVRDKTPLDTEGARFVRLVLLRPE